MLLVVRRTHHEEAVVVGDHTESSIDTRELYEMGLGIAQLTSHQNNFGHDGTYFIAGRDALQYDCAQCHVSSTWVQERTH